MNQMAANKYIYLPLGITAVSVFIAYIYNKSGKEWLLDVCGML
jgi:hypothetical protein